MQECCRVMWAIDLEEDEVMLGELLRFGPPTVSFVYRDHDQSCHSCEEEMFTETKIFHFERCRLK